MTLFAGGFLSCGSCWFLRQPIRFCDKTDYEKITGKKNRYAESLDELKD